MRKRIVKIKSEIIGYIIGSIAAVLMLNGCGQSGVEEVTPAEAPVTEQINESGEVVTEYEDKDYLEYMSEDELRGLAVEALEQEDLDASLAEGKMVTTGIDFEIPAGFEASEERENYWVTHRYPIDITNIAYLERDIDFTMQLIDEISLKELVENAFMDQYKKQVDFNITEYEEMTIDGVPSFRVKADYILDEYHIYQLIYAVNGTKTYVLIYSETDEFDSRMEQFEESAATITVR